MGGVHAITKNAKNLILARRVVHTEYNGFHSAYIRGYPSFDIGYSKFTFLFGIKMNRDGPANFAIDRVGVE